MSENMKNELGTNELEQAAGGAAAKYAVYTVVKGDNLTKIAHAYGVTVKELVAWNNIADPNLILVGQKLKIYVR